MMFNATLQEMGGHLGFGCYIPGARQILIKKEIPQALVPPGEKQVVFDEVEE